MMNLCKGDAGVEAAIVADLDDQAGRRGPVAERTARLDGCSERFLDQHVFAGLERLNRRGDVKLVGDCDDDRLDLRVGQHGGIVAIGDPGLMDSRHPLAQVVGNVADSVKLGVFRLAAGLQVHNWAIGPQPRTPMRRHRLSLVIMRLHPDTAAAAPRSERRGSSALPGLQVP